MNTAKHETYTIKKDFEGLWWEIRVGYTVVCYAASLRKAREWADDNLRGMNEA